MLGACVPAPVLRRFFFLPSPLLLFAATTLAALVLLPSAATAAAAAAHAHTLQQEELEGTPIINWLLQRAVSVEDEDQLPPSSADNFPDTTGLGLYLLGAKIHSPPYINMQRPSSPALTLGRPHFSSSSSQLRPYYMSNIVQSPRKRQSNLGVALMCQLDSRNCAGTSDDEEFGLQAAKKRFVGKKFGGSSWPRTREASLRRTSYLYDGGFDQSGNDNTY